MMTMAYHLYLNLNNLVINILEIAGFILQEEKTILNYLSYTIYNLLFLLIVVVSTAYMTLLERKKLASFHHRRGPNVVGFFGLLQPFADAFKLIFKETIFPKNAMFNIFFLSPLIAVVFGFSNWIMLSLGWASASTADSSIAIMFIFVFSVIHVYSIILAGWSSNSRYSFLGAIRSSAQLVAYDISMGVIFLNIVLFSKTLNISMMVLIQHKVGSFIFYLPMAFIIFLICSLAETNRHPFDLPEAESELVSGYNVEYSAVNFALFFLGEYASMIFMSFFIADIFLGGWASYLYIFKVSFILSIFLMAKAGLPRYRYDQLMTVGWKVILPISLAILFINILVLNVMSSSLLNFFNFCKILL